MHLFTKKHKNKEIVKETVAKPEHIDIAQIYNQEFYDGQARTSYKSAKKVIKIVHQIIPNIKSVLDVGCGVGTWMKAWKDVDSEINVYGIDANELPDEALYVDRKYIEIADLENLQVNKNRYDIVESLEVGEHLSESAANSYVDFLCAASDLILFSAALPKQTGDHHINEQYPEYWNKKFRKERFKCFDILRQGIWNDDDISWWYRQNIMIYARGKSAQFLKKKGFSSTEIVNTYYHPELVKMYTGV